MTRLYYGCDEVPRGWRHYFDRCDLYELRVEESTAPTTKTLNTWRVNSPKGFCFVLHVADEAVQALVAAGESRGGLDSAAFERGWAATLERASAVAAKVLLLETPPEFTPTPNRRELLAQVAEMAREAGKPLIWESSGLWQPEVARPFAEEHGLIYALDPFMADKEGLGFTHGDACFVLHERAGMRRRFDQYDFEQLHAWAQSYQRVFVLLRGRFKWDMAQELKLVLEYADM